MLSDVAQAIPFKPECIVSKGGLVGDRSNAALGTSFSSKNQWEDFDTEMVPVLAQYCINNAGSDTMNSFRIMMAKPEPDSPVVIGPWNGPYEAGWDCVELPITQKNLQSTLTFYNASRVSAVGTFWEYNNNELEPDRTTTIIGLSGDTFTEPVVFSDTEVFYGFEGTYLNNQIQTLGVLVHDPACSVEVVDDPEEVAPEPEVVTPEPTPNVIENPFKPECIVSRGNLVGDTGNAALGTPFSAKN